MCVEADLPDAYAVHRYINHTAQSDIATPEDALNEFKRFPVWMWRNQQVASFVTWCKRYNDYIDHSNTSLFNKVSFYGLDVYSMHRSAHAVIQYLQDVDPVAASRAAERYGCFERFGEDWESYAFAVRYGLSESCENAVIQVLIQLL